MHYASDTDGHKVTVKMGGRAETAADPPARYSSCG
jgi:hypothetical protein